MTLKQEVREALRAYSREAGYADYNHLIANEDQATEAILALVLARLPEEVTLENYKQRFPNGNYAKDAHEIAGYNEAVREFKSALEGL